MAMFGLSYWWHGIFTTDFQRLTYPPQLFWPLYSLVYAILGAVSVFLVSFFELPPRNYALRGLLLGGVLGFVIYLVAFVLGVSFTNSADIGLLAMDFGWQMIEQGFGGLVCGMIYSLVTGFYDIRKKTLKLQ